MRSALTVSVDADDGSELGLLVGTAVGADDIVALGLLVGIASRH